jgi:hypothetical protein
LSFPIQAGLYGLGLYKHHRQTNDFRAGFKVAKWGVFCHWSRLQISPARFKQVYSDKAKASSKQIDL